ncbi:hypothetical protein PPM_2465 [Paenibacillus polymyxa M1]|uniref:Uncharacterized protein n=1 Tax=Paenibacillus polymyxa (strain SC2) TaxID=886882 RepID=E3E628_PAEPS|nr:hypothetical protein PPSC2_12855 [Paenibacillus polymyxa SC2]CCC85402.1 hypothetical protein PPM_2465 [Paenibacillus polymyxa M1]
MTSISFVLRHLGTRIKPIIAGQVANMGADIKLQMESLTTNQLREAADHVLSFPSFKEAVAQKSIPYLNI